MHLIKGVTDQTIDDAFAGIKIGSRKGKPTLYKPLLLLFMIGQYWHNSPRLLMFRDIAEPFNRLLNTYCGSDLHREDTMYPFWYLSRTSQLIWEVEGEETITKWYGTPKRPAISDAKNATSELRGGFTLEVYRRIIHDKVRLLEIAFLLLRKFFPASIHSPLLEAVNIPSNSSSRTTFCNSVMAKYNYSCSVCDFPAAPLDTNMNLQVAYLKALSLGGPKANVNCIAMCSKHKALLEIGAFTLVEGGNIEVADIFMNGDGPSYLLSYHGKKASLPNRKTDRPGSEFISWHNQHVFMAGIGK